MDQSGIREVLRKQSLEGAIVYLYEQVESLKQQLEAQKTVVAEPASEQPQEEKY